MSLSKEKPRLLLLHGFPTGSYDWLPLWSDLSAHFSVLAFDMLGFGQSDRPVGHTYSIFEQASLTTRVLCRVRWQAPIYVLAHDYGLTVLQELLVRHPNFIKYAVLLNGGLFSNAHRPILPQSILALVGPIATPLVSRSFFESTLATTFAVRQDSELLKYMTSIVFDKGPFVVPSLLHYIKERRCNNDRWTAVMHKNIARVSLVWGAEDSIARDVPFGFPDPISIEWIDCAGHFPQWETPHKTLAAVLSAFKKAGNGCSKF